MDPSVLIADLTCRTPQYDRRLGEALQATGLSVDMWAAGCYTDELYDSDLSITAGCMDVAAHVPKIGERLTKRLKAGEYLANLAALYWHVKRTQRDVLHFQWLPLLDVTSIELSVLRRMQHGGTRIVYTVHDVLPLDAQGEAMESSRRRFEALYRQVDALVCHTNASRQQLVDEFGVDASKVWHIPHGPLDPIDGHTMSRGQVDAADVTGVPKNALTVLLFGVLRPYKGYEFLLQAWPQVAEAVEHGHLVIAGRADENVQKHIDALAQETNASDSIARVYRYLEDEELSAVIHAADVLVYPYRNITQSGALFTGMGAGKPIVATSVGGLGETLRDAETADLVEYGDTDALARALVRMLTDPERRRQFGNRVQADLTTRLSWDEIAQQTITCYEETARASLGAS